MTQWLHHEEGHDLQHRVDCGDKRVVELVPIGEDRPVFEPKRLHKTTAGWLSAVLLKTVAPTWSRIER